MKRENQREEITAPKKNIIKKNGTQDTHTSKNPTTLVKKIIIYIYIYMYCIYLMLPELCVSQNQMRADTVPVPTQPFLALQVLKQNYNTTIKSINRCT